jgi:hypothetical protein
MDALRRARRDAMSEGTLVVRIVWFTGSASFLLGGNPGVDDEVVLRDYTEASHQVKVSTERKMT